MIDTRLPYISNPRAGTESDFVIFSREDSGLLVFGIIKPVIPDRGWFTPAQARAVAAELIAQADALEPLLDRPSPDEVLPARDETALVRFWDLDVMLDWAKHADAFGEDIGWRFPEEVYERLRAAQLFPVGQYPRLRVIALSDGKR